VTGIACLMAALGGGTFTNFGGQNWRSVLGASATAGVSFSNNGAITGTGSVSVTADSVTGDTWFFPTTAGAVPVEPGYHYEIRATKTGGSGTLSGPASGTNTTLPASWSTTRSSAGQASAVLAIDIYKVRDDFGSYELLCSGTVTLTATYEV